MKKIILPAMAIMAFGFVSNAQVTQKQPVKQAGIMTTRPAVTTTNVTAKPVTPAAGTKKTTTAVPARKMTAATPVSKTAIKRKHHKKAKKPVEKKQ